MKFHQFFSIIRGRYGAILATLIGTIALAVAVSFLVPPRYSAKATVVIDPKSPNPSGLSLPAIAIPGYISTQADVIGSERVAQKVVDILKLSEDPMLRTEWIRETGGKGMIDAWLVAKLMKKLDVKAKAARESHIVTIQYTASDPAFAAAAVNAFAQAYVETNIEMKADSARQNARWFEEQGKTLRENLENTQRRLSQHHREYGIVSSEERLDIETAKLNELSTQLTAVIGHTTEARSKQRVGTGQALPDIAQNPLIQDLKSQLARAEAKLEELSSHMGVNHPDYQNVEATVASLKRRLDVEAQQIVSGFAAAHSVNRQRERELREAIDAQKRKLLTIKLARDQLDVLRRDVDAAQKAYDMVSQRIHQTTLEGKFEQSDAGILTVAAEPIDPSFPRLDINVAIAVFLGIVGGVAIAFILEVLDRRVHSTDDLIWVIQLPVLGAVDGVKVRGTHLSLPGRALPAH